MRIENHLLKGEGIQFRESPNHSGKLEPDTVIIHYTAGRDAESSIKTLCDPTVKASAHLVVGRDGSITQLVPFNVIAWHAGRSSYKDRVGYNKYSIGIEIDNAGVLTKVNNIYTAWFGREYRDDEVVAAVHRNESTLKYWHRYTEAQITVVEDICRLLVKEYDIQDILGHEEISPQRKIDPGPAFPLDKLRDKILRADRHMDEEDAMAFPANGKVRASRLNIRSGPSKQNNRVADPLARNQKVKILEKSDGWYRVSVELQGWVASEYVDIEH